MDQEVLKVNAQIAAVGDQLLLRGEITVDFTFPASLLDPGRFRKGVRRLS